MIKCALCRQEVREDEYLKHLGSVHNIDAMGLMRFWKTARGLLWTFLVGSICFILGILVGGLGL